MITASTLSVFAPRIVNAEIHAQALEAARAGSTVNTPRRLCHFLGQIFVETAGFTAMIEDFRYRPERLDAVFKAVKGIDDAKALIARGQEAIANRVYANRLGNGDEASGDGWRYRGSGYKQLTGRSNYETSEGSCRWIWWVIPSWRASRPRPAGWRSHSGTPRGARRCPTKGIWRASREGSTDQPSSGSPSDATQR